MIAAKIAKNIFPRDGVEVETCPLLNASHVELLLECKVEGIENR